MPEYIEREAVIEDFKSCGADKWLVDAIVYRIHQHPAAEVEEVRHGEWVRADNDGEWKCSLCGGEIVVDAYGDIHPLDDCGWIGCPYCLAKMDGKGEDDG